MTGPRAWEMPAEPRPEVAAVRTDDGAVYDRDGHGWRYRVRSTVSGVRGTWYTWAQLLQTHERLIDATGDEVP